MAGGFGYERQPQSPSPDPREVGKRLRQQQMGPQMGMGPAMGGDQMVPPPDAEPAEDSDPSIDPQRTLGAVYAGGGGQMGTGSAPAGMPDYAEDDVDASMVHAVGDALSRMGNGLMRPQNPPPERVQRRRSQLAQLGVTPFEIELLSSSGGL